MEALLLAPNTPAQNGNHQRNMQETAHSGDDAFAPMLNEAVTRQQQKCAGKEASTGQKTAQHVNSASADTSAENTGVAFEALLPADTDTSVAMPANLILSAKTSTQISLFSKTGQTLPVQQDSVHPTSLPLSVAPVSPETELQILSVPTEKGEKNLFSLPETNSPVSPKTEALLLEQLQRLIDSGKNIGPVVIQSNAANGSTAQTGGENLQKLSSPLFENNLDGAIQVKQNDAGLLTSENSILKNSRPENVDSLRQDTAGQYFKARIDETSEKNGSQFQQSGSDQQGKNEQNQATLQTGNTIANSSLSAPGMGEPGQGNHFSLNNTLPEQVQANAASKFTPIVSTPVSEDKIVDNLIQRFNVNPRLQSSKLSMQLHPAQLGELKIDLQIKEDSIRANIVVQSQQVMDTLDKNMPRLRSALQEQGFNIDSFTITMDTEGDRGQELFQEHFSSQQHNSSYSTRTSSLQDESFAQELKNIRETIPSPAEETVSSGVNVTV